MVNKPMFASFIGSRNGSPSYGWCVFDTSQPIASGDDVESLTASLEEKRGYEKGTMVLLSFQRLEDPAALSSRQITQE